MDRRAVNSKDDFAARAVAAVEAARAASDAMRRALGEATSLLSAPPRRSTAENKDITKGV